MVKKLKNNGSSLTALNKPIKEIELRGGGKIDDTTIESKDVDNKTIKKVSPKKRIKH